MEVGQAETEQNHHAGKSKNDTIDSHWMTPLIRDNLSCRADDAEPEPWNVRF